MTETPFRTTPEPAKIFAEASAIGCVTLTIDTSEATTAIDLLPEEAYSIARYLEWLAAPGPCQQPSNECPAGTGVWGEITNVGRLAHVVIVPDDDDSGFGTVIALDMSRASQLSDQLYRGAVEASGVEEDDDE